MNDHELISKIKNPDTKDYGFNLLVQEYQERIYFHVRRMVIDHDETNDLVQETFIKVYRKLDKFRGDSSLFTWIYRIATNLSLNHLKSKKRRFFLPIADLSEEWIAQVNESPLITGETIQKELHSALVRLPDKQRLVFNLKYFEELPYEQISKITGTSVGALKASYHHAVKKIEEYLNQH